ncbi:hypothetical protein ACROYT_G017459 [Oculina patagonica]
MSAQQLHEYVPPKWATPLKNIPQHYVKLAQRDTPIHSWKIPNVPKEFSLFIKRDDLTGCTLSGNKTTEIGCQGNLLLSRMVGSHIVVVPDMDYDSGLSQIIETMAEKLKQQGSSPYVIAYGGSMYMSIFGYVTAFQEMMNQNLLEDFDDIVLTAGTGGSASGIAIANYLTGSKLKCHTVTVYFNAASVYEKVNKHLRDGGLDVRAEDIIDVIDGYQGEEYAVNTQDDLETILEISSTTGVLLDPLYNITAIRAMLAEMNNNPGRFKGRRILYIHTGGVFNLFDGRMDPIITNPKSEKSLGQVLRWGDINGHPPC